MSKIFILVDSAVGLALSNTQLKEIDTYGPERIVDENGTTMASGIITLVEGSSEDFSKLLDAVGVLWAATNPMCGQWQHMLVDKENEIPQ